MKVPRQILAQNVSRHMEFGQPWTGNKSWLREPASEGQRKRLAELGVPLTETKDWSKARATQVIDRLRPVREQYQRGGRVKNGHTE